MVANVRPLRVIGRYLVAEPIAAGGMATVYLGRLIGEEGFSRTVALKQPHPHFSRDSEFVDMFLDEARMLSRIRHPNVVAPLDVVLQDGELFIAMEYVHGETLSRLVSAGNAPVPPAIASAILTQVLFGLHAAHEALGEGGKAMDIVHRDVSPQNILVGEDGVAKVVDFGIARALLRNHTTEAGLLKGKLGYMAPEQLRFEAVDRRTDLYGAGIVLWELLTGRRLFAAETPADARNKVLGGTIPKPSSIVPSLPPELDHFIMQSLAADPGGRFQNARAMAGALGHVVSPASVLDVGAWVQRVAGATLAARSEKIIELEMVSPSELTLAKPHRPQGSSAPGEVSSFREPPAREVGGRMDHTGLSMSPSSLTKDPGRRSPRARIWIPTAALVIALLGVLLALTQRRSAEHEAAQPSLGGRHSSPAAAAPAPNPAALEPRQEPAEAEAPSVAPPALQASTPVVAASAPAAAKSTRPASGKPKPHGASAACDPPYSIDSDGIKHFKPECFK
jgi:serine/threonine-protein kinase